MNANKKLTAISEIISAKNGAASAQEYGLTYCQAVDFLDKIEEILKPKHDINWFTIIADRLPDHSDEDVWCNNGDEIMCRSSDAADAIADLIESLYRSQGEEVIIVTGYYDPEEDERNGETDRCTGWWYVNMD